MDWRECSGLLCVCRLQSKPPPLIASRSRHLHSPHLTASKRCGLQKHHKHHPPSTIHHSHLYSSIFSHSPSPQSPAFQPQRVMLGFASKAMRGTVRFKNDVQNPITTTISQPSSDCSDDDRSITTAASREERLLECPICWESFNIVENVPYVLWCGHSLCKNCVLGLQRAVLKLPTLPIQLPFFISCPWCNLLSFRFVYKGNLRFPSKNYFLLWMVECLNGDRSSVCYNHGSSNPVSTRQTNLVSNRRGGRGSDGGGQDLNVGYVLNAERIKSSIRKSLVFFVHLTAKFPLIVVFLLIVLYAIPASVAILALYVLITLVFALPSFLVLYFAFPSLDWLVREIVT